MLSYNSLPGIELEIKDGNLILPAEPSPTQTLLIIAPTTEEGVEGDYEEEEFDPVIITGQSDFVEKKNRLGAYSTANPLARLWKQAYDAGCRDIRAIVLKGKTPEEKYQNLHKIYSILEDNINADIIVLGGVYVGESAPSAELDGETEDYAIRVVHTVSNEIITPQEIEGEIVYKAQRSHIVADTFTLNYKNSNEVLTGKYSINLETGVITFEEDFEPDPTKTLLASYNYTFNKDFAAQLAGFCDVVSRNNRQVIGVMAIKAPLSANLATVKKHVEEQKNQIYSKHLQVVGGSPLWFNLGSAVYEDMWHGAYAGLISVLASYSSPTNKVIPGALFASYNLSPTQITSLINKHIVVPRFKNGRIIIADAITTAPDSSDFVRLTTLRITNDVIQLVRELADPYIGEPNTMARRNALDTAVREGLQNMVARGALNDFRFHIQASIADQIDGTMRILLDIVPVFETRRIMIAVALKPML